MNPKLANYKCIPKIKMIRKSSKFYDSINQYPMEIYHQPWYFAKLVIGDLKELNSKSNTRDFLKIISEKMSQKINGKQFLFLQVLVLK